MLRSQGLVFGELIRDYEPAAGSVWRYGKPDYARVNKTYFNHRSMAHHEGSLEALVQKIVKNWQVEADHIAAPWPKNSPRHDAKGGAQLEDHGQLEV